MQKWYVVHTAPGAQRACAYDSRMTNIEHTLQTAGIAHYMPIEMTEVVHHRKKKIIEKRRPLIPGYAFVTDIRDWLSLSRCDGVASVLGVQGEPTPITDLEIFKLRLAEAEIYRTFEKKRAFRIEQERLKAEKANGVSLAKARGMFPAGAPIIISDRNHHLAGAHGRVRAATGRQTVKAMIETIGGMMNVELPLASLFNAA